MAKRQLQGVFVARKAQTPSGHVGSVEAARTATPHRAEFDEAAKMTHRDCGAPPRTQSGREVAHKLTENSQSAAVFDEVRTTTARLGHGCDEAVTPRMARPGRDSEVERRAAKPVQDGFAEKAAPQDQPAVKARASHAHAPLVPAAPETVSHAPVEQTRPLSATEKQPWMDSRNSPRNRAVACQDSPKGWSISARQVTPLSWSEGRCQSPAPSPRGSR